MVKNQRNFCRFPYLDNAIFQPSKMELVQGFEFYFLENLFLPGIQTSRWLKNDGSELPKDV